MEKDVQNEFKEKSRLTAKALLEKRGLIEQKKNRVIEIEVDELGLFRFRVPDKIDIADCNEHDDSDAVLVYQCCLEPNLKDKELQDGFGCSFPIDIVNKLMLPGEVALLATELTKAAGYDSELIKVIDNIKN